MRAWLGSLILILPLSAHGLKAERETFSLIGWNDACSVAVSHQGYPALGQGIYNDPIFSRIGTLTIAPGQDSATAAWDEDTPGSGAWNRLESPKIAETLRAAGYDQAGFEEILPAPAGGQDGPAAVLLSSAAFSLRMKKPWPGSPWRWDRSYYSPLNDCGLFVFARGEAARPAYLYLLARIYDPAARLHRARAHISNARLLMESGNLSSALPEVKVAAAIAPSDASIRYQHAAILCLAGELEAAQTELAAAIKIDPAYKQHARRDMDFESISSLERFQLLTREQK
ncbi:MAG: tetratricopeptide repeat protein [Elusimicrobiota bacterium]